MHVVLCVGERASHVREHAWGGNDRFDRLRLALTWRTLRRMLPDPPEPVLELGPGSGLLLGRVGQAGYEVHGVEPGMLGEQRSARSWNAHLYAMEVEVAPLPGRHFALAYGIHVVEHMRDPRKGLANVARSLRPGGRLLLLTPDATSAGRRVFGPAWWNYEDPTHRRFFSPASITRLLRDTGFTSVSVSRPLLDSLTMESLSLLRRLRPRVRRHGIMAGTTARTLACGLLPATVVARLLWRALRPSLMVTAVRRD